MTLKLQVHIEKRLQEGHSLGDLLTDDVLTAAFERYLRLEVLLNNKVRLCTYSRDDCKMWLHRLFAFKKHSLTTYVLRCAINVRSPFVKDVHYAPSTLQSTKGPRRLLTEGRMSMTKLGFASVYCV